MNADYFLENIVDHAMPFAPFVNPNFIVMQDTAHPHTSANIPLMVCQLKSPDLNPVKHLRNYLEVAGFYLLVTIN